MMMIDQYDLSLTLSHEIMSLVNKLLKQIQRMFL